MSANNSDETARQTEPAEELSGVADDPRAADEPRELFVFRAGGRLFAVFGDEVEATAEGLRPAPLPFAPPTVVGVVSLRGRIRTVLDPLKLLDVETQPPAATATTDLAPSDHASAAPADEPETPPRLFVALAGDEQLALACERAEETVHVSAAEVKPPPDASAPARGRVERAGAVITLLDPSRLFDAAMRGTERRRRRRT